jgi:DNA-binding transcriptional LysR family regulator
VIVQIARYGARVARSMAPARSPHPARLHWIEIGSPAMARVVFASKEWPNSEFETKQDKADQEPLAKSGRTDALLEIFAGFLSKHTHIDVDLEERPSHVIVEAIASGAADMGIAIARSDFDHLEHRPFRTDRLVVLTSREWPRFRRNQSTAFNEVATEPFVGLSPGNPLQEHIVRQAACLGHQLAFRMRLATLDAVCRLVSRGIGIAAVPEVAARRARSSKSAPYRAA